MDWVNYRALTFQLDNNMKYFTKFDILCGVCVCVKINIDTTYGANTRRRHAIDFKL